MKTWPSYLAVGLILMLVSLAKATEQTGNFVNGTTLQTTLNATDTSDVITIGGTTAGWPTSGTFSVVIDPTGSPEGVTVTAVAGTSWTITRGEWLTQAAHSVGVAIAGPYLSSRAMQQIKTDASAGGTSAFVFPQSFGAKPDAQVHYDGTITNGSNVLIAEGQTTVNGNQTLPEATLTVTATAVSQWTMPGNLTIGSNTVACTGFGAPTVTNGNMVTTFTGCSGGSGTISSGATVTQPHSVFSANNVGQLICVSSISGTYGPNNSGTPISVMPQSELCGTIGIFTSASQVTLAGIISAHGSTMNGATYRFGTDNHAALQNAINSCVPNGCTIYITGAFGSSDGLSVPVQAPVSFLGSTSYVPDLNYNTGHELVGPTAGIWFITKSMTKAGITYGDPSIVVQQTPQEMRNFALIAGSGPGLCPNGVDNSQCFANGFFGTLDGGGNSGVVVQNTQHILMSSVEIANFSRDCYATGGSVVQSASIHNAQIAYCGGNGVNFSVPLYDGLNGVYESDIGQNGLNGVLWNANCGGNCEDDIMIEANTLQGDDVLGTGAHDINIAHGRYAVIIGNQIENGAGGGPGSGTCFNAGTNDAQGYASALWIANSGFDFVQPGCETIQQKVDMPLPTCAYPFVGSFAWTNKGDGTVASPACTYGQPASFGGTAICQIMCTQTGASSFAWLYSGGGGALVTNGHITAAPQATPPVVSSCGTSPSAIVGNDAIGSITAGTGTTSCTITWGKSYGATPFCGCKDLTTAADKNNCSNTTTNITFSPIVAGDQLQWSCQSTS